MTKIEKGYYRQVSASGVVFHVYQFDGNVWNNVTQRYRNVKYWSFECNGVVCKGFATKRSAIKTANEHIARGNA